MLAMGQQILVLDEPTFGQDQRNAAELLHLLRNLHQEGRTVIIVTHDMTLVAEYAQHVAVMSRGKVLAHGETRAIFARPDLLAEARLKLPPLAQLAGQGHVGGQPLSPLLTVEDFVASYTGREQREIA
jgi:energy-coupling factor transport system ATP-binding protein